MMSWKGKKRSKIEVSIVMPVLNSEKFLAEAIESVLGQKFQNWEFVVVEGRSKDNSLEILEKFAKQDKRLKIIKAKGKGVSHAANIGIKKAKGKFVVRMDADDVCFRERIGKEIKFMKKHPEIGVVGSACVMIDEKGKELYVAKKPAEDKGIKKYMYFKCPFFHPTIMARRKLLLSVGGYDEKLKVGEDYDLWARLGRKTKFANIAEPLLYYRKHDENLSLRKFEEMRSVQGKILNYMEKNYEIASWMKMQKHIGIMLDKLVVNKIRKIIWKMPRV
ncbi:MAG: glycosyltransferase [Candidatus Micrarchaeota archaeon]